MGVWSLPRGAFLGVRSGLLLLYTCLEKWKFIHRSSLKSYCKADLLEHVGLWQGDHLQKKNSAFSSEPTSAN